MVKSRSERPTRSDELQELREAVERLSQRIEVLTDIIDRLPEELEWRTSTPRSFRELSPPSAPSGSPSAAPVAGDEPMERGSDETVGSIGERLNGHADVTPQPPHCHDQLCREIAELRQIVAALVLMTSGHDFDGLSTAYDWLLEWASQEFDPEILKESLPKAVIDAIDSALAPTPSHAITQPTLQFGGDAEFA